MPTDKISPLDEFRHLSPEGRREARARRARRNEHFDGVLEDPNGNFFVETKRTSGLREVRGALLGLAYTLLDDDAARARVGSDGRSLTRPPAKAILVLLDSQITPGTLEAELAQFRAAADKTLAPRIFAIAAKADVPIAYWNLPPGTSADLAGFISQIARQEDENAARTTRVSRQTVKAVLLESYVAGKEYAQSVPSSTAELQRATGASYPTVAGALKDLDAQHLLATIGDGRSKTAGGAPMLLRPTPDVWRRIAEAHAAERRIARYIDPTGQARPDRLLRRLRMLITQRQGGDGRAFHGRGAGSEFRRWNLAVGGVVGAAEHYPALDITAAPRLDLCVFDNDDSFVQALDPGLVLTEDPKAQAVLVLHFTRDLQTIDHLKPIRTGTRSIKYAPTTTNMELLSADENMKKLLADPIPKASAIDCYADLLEMGYVGEATDFARSMTAKAGW